MPRTTAKKEPHPLDLLPFTAKRDGKQLPKYDNEKGELPRCFWNVTPTGRYGEDCETGNRYALLYLEYEERGGSSGGVLTSIIADMPRTLTGIEIGFLQMVSYAAGAGAHRARQVRAHWDKCASEEWGAA